MADEGVQTAKASPMPSKRLDIGARHDWYFLSLLTLGYAVACLDRFSFNILIEPIQRDLNATDAEMGLLGGAAFILFYAGFGVPMAQLADKGNRVRLLSAAIGVWSLLTALMAFTTSVLQAGLARVGVGIAESAGNPASLSLISDRFSEQKRPVAVSIYQSGMAISSLLSSPIVGYIGYAYGWRAAFIAISIPGFLLALLIWLTVREPRRLMKAGESKPAGHSWWSGVKTLFGIKNFFVLFLTQLFIGIPTGVLPVWLTVLMIRDHGINLQQVGLIAMLFFGVIMLLAFVGSGYLISWVVGLRGRREWGAFLPGMFTVAAAPFAILMLLADNLVAVLCLASVFFLFMFAGRPAANTLALELAPAQNRGLAVSLLLIATSVIGGGLGPWAVGFMSDAFAPDVGRADGLRWALMLMVPAQVFISGCLFLLIGRQMRRDRMAKAA